MSITPAEVNRVYAQADPLFDLAQVETALDALVAPITHTLGDKNPIVLCVMNGGLQTAGRLLTRMNFPLQQGYVHATRYRNTTQGHELKWVQPPSLPIQDRHVLIIDDILDEGYTLQALSEACNQMGAASVHSAILCEKQRSKDIEISADHVALQVPDRYVFGYGMDYKGYLRNAPGIFAVHDDHA